MNFELDDLIMVAKRENNNKRKFLYVNPIQGKHIPVSPSKSMEMFSVLAQKTEESYKNERLLIIGFAETATAIGSAVAYMAKNAEYYISTTRENVENSEYLFFTESHSHATEQKLSVKNFENIIGNIDRIVFVEDEVTTGNTIKKLIDALNERYPEYSLKFGIVSVLNCMSENVLNEFKTKGIVCEFIGKIPFGYRINEIENYSYKSFDSLKENFYSVNIDKIFIDGYFNSRTVNDVNSMRILSDRFVKKAIEKINLKNDRLKILILGTEEFMFQPMLLGYKIEKKYKNAEVKFHATTRSPIEISDDTGYPLNSRFSLESLYEECRDTFVYNLLEYDNVFIVTDCKNINEKGMINLISALEKSNNKNISLIKWGDGR